MKHTYPAQILDISTTAGSLELVVRDAGTRDPISDLSHDFGTALKQVHEVIDYAIDALGRFVEAAKNPYPGFGGPEIIPAHWTYDDKVLRFEAPAASWTFISKIADDRHELLPDREKRLIILVQRTGDAAPAAHFKLPLNVAAEMFDVPRRQW